MKSTGHKKKVSRRFIAILPRGMNVIRAEMREISRNRFSIPQLRILAELYYGSKTPTELSEHHGVSLPAMSHLISGLVDRKLVTRVRSTLDRRELVLRLTPRGAATFSMLTYSLEIALDPYFNALSKAELRTLREAFCLLEKVVNQVEKENADAPPNPSPVKR